MFKFKIKDKLRKSFKDRILKLVIMCWVVPISIIFIFIFGSYRNGIIARKETLISEEIKNSVSFTAHRINQAISVSRKISYESNIEESWKKYKKNTITYNEFHNRVLSSLRDIFYIDDRMSVISVFYLCDNPEDIYYVTRQRYDYINIYNEQVSEKAHEISKQDTTDVNIQIIEDKIYIIRNLYTISNFTKFGTLVIEIDKEKLFETIINSDRNYKVLFYVNNTDSKLTYDGDIEGDDYLHIVNKVENEYFNKNDDNVAKINHNNFQGFFYEKKYNDFKIGIVLIVDRFVEYSQLNELMYIVLVILSIIVPVLIYVLYFISHNITRPMGKMMDASKMLEKGEIGLQIDTDSIPNLEFYYLMESFNRMSSEVKYLFDYAYNEKLAQKDAKIIALQSQINPHFLNNTLEMMNWQARMTGDLTVSRMIEALGTLLDYSMDRSNKKLIRLYEEIRCADAYLYIISMRFGQRVLVEKDIDQSLMQLLIPQLILQPLLENAVKHGIEKSKSGTIRLNIIKEDENVKLIVLNSGPILTKKEEERIKYILNCRQDELEEVSDKHITMGIRNVNERIKLIYGKNYGLSIKANEDGETVATITIPFEYILTNEEDDILENMSELLR